MLRKIWLRKICIALAAIAALGGGALLATTSAQAQWYGGPPGFAPPPFGPPPGHYGPRGYRPPPPPPVYGHPAYGPPRHHRRCWDRPVEVWNGFDYETRMQRVCR